MPICPICGQELPDGALQCRACVARAKRHTGMGEALDRLHGDAEPAPPRESDPEAPTAAGKKAAARASDPEARTAAGKQAAAPVAEPDAPEASKPKVDRQAPTVKRVRHADPETASPAPAAPPMSYDAGAVDEPAPGHTRRWMLLAGILLLPAGVGGWWVLRIGSSEAASASPPAQAAVSASVHSPRRAAVARPARAAPLPPSRCPGRREVVMAGVSFCYPAAMRRGYTQWTSGAYGAQISSLSGSQTVLTVRRYLELTRPDEARRTLVKELQAVYGKAALQVIPTPLKGAGMTLPAETLRAWSRGHLVSHLVVSFLSHGHAVVIELVDQLDARGRPSAEAAEVLRLLRKTLRIQG